jgi:hypothetical protein
MSKFAAVDEAALLPPPCQIKTTLASNAKVPAQHFISLRL